MSGRIRPQRILQEINRVTSYFVSKGITRAQNFSIQRTAGNFTDVTFDTARLVGGALRDLPYEEIHRQLIIDKAFNIRMIDNALLQFMYRFDKRGIVKHRLAFFPSPNVDDFLRYPRLHSTDDRRLGIEQRTTIPVPLRFDYDVAAAKPNSAHAASHLTIGGYRRCRIPVSAPLTPRMFAEFILQYFYLPSIADGLPPSRIRFPTSISELEKKKIYLMIPQ